MADLTDILGGIFTPPSEPEPKSPEVQLQDAMAEHGLIPPREIIFDGKLRKFEGVRHKNRNKSSWYYAFENEKVPGACFGDFSLNNLRVNWHANIGRDLTPEEESDYQQKIAEIRLDIEKREISRKNAAKIVFKRIWSTSKPAPYDHPYLVKKRILPHCARVNEYGELILPLFNSELELVGLQFIECHGDNFIKKFRTGSEPKGAFCIIGEIDDSYTGRLYVAEGFATAASIHEATGVPVVVAYSANNLSAAISSAKESLPRNEIIIVADNDASETGQREAEKAANQHNITYIIPPIEGDANDFVNNGGDLKSILDGVKVKKRVLTAVEMVEKPSPINWMVEGFVQENALVMVFGQSGSGKTFVVLDWCLRMASGITEWNGKRIKPGTVMYLAGEGVYGMKGRMAAFYQHHGIDPDTSNIYTSTGGYDINTAEGLKSAFDDISSLPEKPLVVVIDTLHRFFNGDENSSRDVKTMLDACNAIMREFDCTVIIVHHTGVSSEAQNRARGSSAWRAALDIEIAITQKNGIIEVCQKKAKDSELSDPEFLQLLPIEIDGWVDQYGAAFKSAVVVPSEKKPDDNVDDENETRRQKKPPMVEKYKQLISAAWLYGSCKATIESRPYISREDLKKFLAENEGMKSSTIEQHLKPSSGRMISKLIECAYIEPCNDGWLIISDQDSSALMLLSEETNEETDAD
jgi:phage/plasmid primase-like uncharacterized protein